MGLYWTLYCYIGRARLPTPTADLNSYCARASALELNEQTSALLVVVGCPDPGQEHEQTGGDSLYTRKECIDNDQIYVVVYIYIVIL